MSEEAREISAEPIGVQVSALLRKIGIAHEEQPDLLERRGGYVLESGVSLNAEAGFTPQEQALDQLILSSYASPGYKEYLRRLLFLPGYPDYVGVGKPIPWKKAGGFMGIYEDSNMGIWSTDKDKVMCTEIMFIMQFELRHFQIKRQQMQELMRDILGPLLGDGYRVGGVIGLQPQNIKRTIQDVATSFQEHYGEGFADAACRHFNYHESDALERQMRDLIEILAEAGLESKPF